MDRTSRSVGALALWTLAVWGTRIRNIWGDAGLDTGARLGRGALALSFVVLAVAAIAALWRRHRGATPGWLHPLVLVLVGWTTAVWVVRAVAIVIAGHSAAFVVVHLVLAVVSIGLAALAVQAVTARRPVRA